MEYVYKIFAEDIVNMATEFWLDTYFDNEAGEFRFSHSDDLLSDFSFIEPEVNMKYTKGCIL